MGWNKLLIINLNNLFHFTNKMIWDLHKQCFFGSNFSGKYLAWMYKWLIKILKCCQYNIAKNTILRLIIIMV